MYSGTRLLKYISSAMIFLYFANTSYLFAQEIKDLPISVSEPIYLKYEDVVPEINVDNVKKKEFKLFKNSSVYRVNFDYGILNLTDKKNNTNTARTNKITSNLAGSYIFALSQDEVNNVLEPFLSIPPLDLPSDKVLEIPKPSLINNFRVIQDFDNRVFFTDGSLIVKFNKDVNYSEFASINNLMLKKEYIDLKLGIYIHKDFNTLESKINFLKEINLVSDVQYNIINPYILSE